MPHSSQLQEHIFLFRLLDFFYVGFIFFFISQCLLAMGHISFRVKNYVFCSRLEFKSYCHRIMFPSALTDCCFHCGSILILYQNENSNGSVQMEISSHSFI